MQLFLLPFALFGIKPLVRDGRERQDQDHELLIEIRDQLKLMNERAAASEVVEDSVGEITGDVSLSDEEKLVRIRQKAEAFQDRAT